jgi:signal transduction histidine kinase
VQPVFEAIVQSARRLCDASYSSVYRLDGQLVHLVAHNHQTPEAAETFRSAWPMPLSGDSFVVRAIRENAVIHTDMQEDPTTSAALLTRAKAVGHRRILVVPMVREGQPIGGIRVSRAEATSFAEHHIALLQTFADQAVIAIENVRLFKELEASNREIAEKSRQIEVASQHKSEFLANMSHELRTPLNAIIGFSEVLSERMFGELNEKQEEYLKDIYASGTHLLSLINDILDLSKIEAGRMELELSDFHLPQAIENALTLVRERAGRRGIALAHTMDERLGEIRGDERKIKQVLLNLLSNAIKFTPEGGRIEVAAAPKDGSVEISVSDTGVGIAPEDQERVFEEFRQVGTADKKAEGTGLGLTLCRKFVELYGGRIWVKSRVGVGSTFKFTIPMAEHP